MSNKDMAEGWRISPLRLTPPSDHSVFGTDLPLTLVPLLNQVAASLLYRGRRAANVRKAMAMSTALLALALLIGLGIVTFGLSLGLTGLGILLSWVFPLTPFQGTVIHVVLFVLAIFLLGLTLLVERVKDTLIATTAEGEEHLDEMIKLAEHDGRHAGEPTSLPVRHTESKVGRNDPCPCGSGKKYKFCCLMKA